MAQAIAKTEGYSPQTDSGTPLLKTTPTELIKYGKVELMTT